jgi:hypothetical protein
MVAAMELAGMMFNAGGRWPMLSNVRTNLLKLHSILYRFRMCLNK